MLNTEMNIFFTRLYFFLVSFGLSNLIKSFYILPSILTDHSLIKLSIMLNNEKRAQVFGNLTVHYSLTLNM